MILVFGFVHLYFSVAHEPVQLMLVTCYSLPTGRSTFLYVFLSPWERSVCQVTSRLSLMSLCWGRFNKHWLCTVLAPKRVTYNTGAWAVMVWFWRKVLSKYQQTLRKWEWLTMKRIASCRRSVNWGAARPKNGESKERGALCEEWRNMFFDFLVSHSFPYSFSPFPLCAPTCLQEAMMRMKVDCIMENLSRNGRQ